MNNNSETETFLTFYSGWISRQQEFLDELLSFLPPNQNDGGEERMNDLLSRVRLHYLQYFKAKDRLIQTDVYSVLSSNWLSTYERTILWIGGLKPSLTFRFVSNSDDLRLTPNQESRIEAVRVEISEDEKWLNAEFDRIRWGNYVAPHVEEDSQQQRSIMNKLESSLETLVACADSVRVKATTKLIEVLDPIQSVRLYVGIARFQLMMREMGLDTARRVGR